MNKESKNRNHILYLIARLEIKKVASSGNNSIPQKICGPRDSFPQVYVLSSLFTHFIVAFITFLFKNSTKLSIKLFGI